MRIPRLRRLLCCLVYLLWLLGDLRKMSSFPPLEKILLLSAREDIRKPISPRDTMANPRIAAGWRERGFEGFLEMFWFVVSLLVGVVLAADNVFLVGRAIAAVGGLCTSWLDTVVFAARSWSSIAGAGG